MSKQHTADEGAGKHTDLRGRASTPNYSGKHRAAETDKPADLRSFAPPNRDVSHPDGWQDGGR